MPAFVWTFPSLTRHGRERKNRPHGDDCPPRRWPYNSWRLGIVVFAESCQLRGRVVMDPDHSVTHWLRQIEVGDEVAAQEIWQR